MRGRHPFVVLDKKRAAQALLVLFLAAVLLVLAAALIPRAADNAAAAAGRKLPIYCTDRPGKVVSLTFDAAWGDEDTGQLIDILGKYGVRATFFVVGEWAQRCSDSAKALHDAGHEIMNHSDTHAHMPQLSREGILAEINTCSDKIQAITGKRPTLFRAPYGDYDNALVETVEALGMSCIQWDVDSLDWKNPPVEEMVKRVTGEVSSGSIVLFHNGAQNTPAALPRIIEELRAQGYTFLPVSEMIYYENYTINHEGRQIAAPAAGSPALAGGNPR